MNNFEWRAPGTSAVDLLEGQAAMESDMSCFAYVRFKDGTFQRIQVVTPGLGRNCTEDPGNPAHCFHFPSSPSSQIVAIRVCCHCGRVYIEGLDVKPWCGPHVVKP